MFPSSVLLLGLVATLLVAGHCKDICTPDDSCTEPVDIPITQDQIDITACAGHLINLNFTALKQTQDTTSCSVSVLATDASEDEFEHIFYFADNLADNQEVYSPGSSVAVRFAFNETLGRCPISLTVSCLPNYSVDHAVQGYGENETDVYVPPNTKQTFNFQTSTTTLNFNLNSTQLNPLAGYSVVTLGDGSSYIKFGHLDSVAIETKGGVSKLELITFTQQVEYGLSWDLGEEPLPLSTTTTIKTTTTPEREYLSVFVLSVNENTFVSNHLEDIRTEAWNIMIEVCEDIDTTINLVSFASVTSCRSSCHMTSQEDRGCVKTELDLIDIAPTVNCNTGTQSNIQYLRSQLEGRLDELATTVAADKVFLDSCTDITISTPWVIIAIVLTIGSVLLAAGIMTFVSVRHKWSKNDINIDVQVVKEPQYWKTTRDDHWEYEG